jgi:hypothetical protein
MLGKAKRYEVVKTGCIPAGFILKGIYGSTSVIGDCSLFQIERHESLNFWHQYSQGLKIII